MLSEEALSEIMWGFKEWIKDGKRTEEKEWIDVGSL